MKRISLSPPQIFLAVLAALFVFWLVYVGLVLWPRFNVPPIDTSAPLLLTGSGQTSLVGKTNTNKNVGPVTLWRDGIVYWNVQKSGLFLMRPGQKAQAIGLRPHQNLSPTSLVSAKNGVFINSSANSNVVFVHLPDGASKIMPKMIGVRGRESSAAIAYQVKNTSFVVQYPGGGTRTAPAQYVNAWDYDPARDAFVWLQNGEVVYQSKARTWRKAVGYDYDTASFAGLDGAIWLQKNRSSRSEIWVIDIAGRERGLRWRSADQNYYIGGEAKELTPAQADLVRALPDGT